jgi:ureidoacrylate peracid hydrolase
LHPKFQSSTIKTSTGCDTSLQTLTLDGIDISLDYKLSGLNLANIPNISCTQLFKKNDNSKPMGDILIPKSSRSVFQPTNIDYVLRNLGIAQLAATGQLAK